VFRQQSPDDVGRFFENIRPIAKSKTLSDDAFLGISSFSEEFVSGCGAGDTLFGLLWGLWSRSYPSGATELWIVLPSKLERA
jgi:hypothetical protein